MLADGAGQAALHRDVLSQPGVRTVFVLEGVNDLKAHTAAGLCAVGATVMPYEGWSEYDEAGEAVRQGVNDWIRHGGAVDLSKLECAR